VYQKSLFIVGHPMDGTPIQDEDMRQAFMPTLEAAARSYDQAAMYTPLFNQLSDGEIERGEKEREKEMKRKRRQTRGRRGVALPDREPLKSYRTPAIGFPDVDPATSAAGITAPTTSKRAAAAAASLTIANMVASENGGPVYTAPVVIQEKPTAPPKPSRKRGLFKPPNFPSSILRPRAFMTAATSSTALESAKRPERPADLNSANLQGRAGLVAAKRPKDEYVAEGQHRNMIDGVWHCSNCGCPDGIAIGRRKGPNGVKSQCGQCGE
jgi:SWI/SNF-related matrix-associated actin-dependent regulator of chromatin subfamily B protein 1